MFFVTTSIVCASLSVGLNSTTSVPANRIGVWPGSHVIGVPGLKDLLGSTGAKGHLALDHVAHVLALALVVWESAEERREVGVLGVGLEADRPAAVEVLEVTFVPLYGLVVGRTPFDAFGISTS